VKVTPAATAQNALANQEAGSVVLLAFDDVRAGSSHDGVASARRGRLHDERERQASSGGGQSGGEFGSRIQEVDVARIGSSQGGSSGQCALGDGADETGIRFDRSAKRG